MVGLFTIVRCYPLPRTSFAPRLGFCTVGKPSRFVYGRRYGVRTLGRSRPRLARLVPLMGKASVSNITVSLGLPSSQKPLTWPVCRLWLARSRSFPPPPPGSVRLHRTATEAGTLLLSSFLIVWPHLGYAWSWYCTASLALSNALVDVISPTRFVATVHLRYSMSAPQVPWFSGVTAVAHPLCRRGGFSLNCSFLC